MASMKNDAETKVGGQHSHWCPYCRQQWWHRDIDCPHPSKRKVVCSN